MTEGAPRQKIRWVAAAAAAALVIVVIVILAFRPVNPPPVLPNPNGYDDLVKAGAQVSEFQRDYRELSEPELRQLVASNAPALELMRTGLSRECRVPIENSPDFMARHLPQLSIMKRLALALAAEGKLAEVDGDTNRAVRCYVDAIRLGHEAGRDGLLIDAMVGRACEAIGVAPLEKAVGALNADNCRRVIQELQAIEARRQPAEETLRIERKWSHETFGFLMRVHGMIAARTSDPIGKAFKSHATKVQAARARQSQILVALATRAFKLENGRLPSSLSELVPGYLSALPPDLTTNAVGSAGALKN